MFPASRLLTDEVEGTEMEGVEHLGQYVFEMTQAKVEMLKKRGNVLPPQEAEMRTVKDEEMGGEVEVDEGHEQSDLDEIT